MGFFILMRGAHRVGGGKIRVGPGNKGLLRRGAHQAGGGKIRLLAMIRLGWNRARGLLASELQCLFRLSYGSLLHLDLFTGEGYWAGGGKIRLGNFLLPGEALAGLEAERSVSGISCSQERRSHGWRWKDPSWTWE